MKWIIFALMFVAASGLAAEAPIKEVQLELRAVQAERDKFVIQFQYAERLRQEAEVMLPRLVTRENELKAIIEAAEKKK